MAHNKNNKLVHHAKHITIQETPTNSLIPVIVEAIQKLSDTGELNIATKKVDHMLNIVIRRPTVVLKSYDMD